VVARPAVAPSTSTSVAKSTCRKHSYGRLRTITVIRQARVASAGQHGDNLTCWCNHTDSCTLANVHCSGSIEGQELRQSQLSDSSSAICGRTKQGWFTPTAWSMQEHIDDALAFTTLCQLRTVARVTRAPATHDRPNNATGGHSSHRVVPRVGDVQHALTVHCYCLGCVQGGGNGTTACASESMRGREGAMQVGSPSTKAISTPQLQ
jgi:hypothetical protein